jgi:hypothetical protein
MPCGGGLPKAAVGVSCRVATTNAPPDTPRIRVVLDPADQIDALGVGVPFTSTGSTETWDFTCTSAGQWTSRRVS